jgi:hypothetical protein
MPRSYASTVVAAEPDAVWTFLRNFDGTPEFLEAIASSEILDGKLADQVGAERKLTLGDGSLVRERLVALSDLDRSYTYHLLEGPFPFTAYYSTIRVSPVSDEGTSFVEWWSTYDCDATDAKAMDDLLAGDLYSGGLAAVQTRFAGA